MNLTKDCAEKSFAQELDQIKFLQELKGNTEWFRAFTRELKIIGPSEAVIKNAVDEETAIHGENLFIYANDEVYPLGDTALTTLYSRAGISGPGIRQLYTNDKDKLANVLSLMLSERKGESLLLLENGKVRAVHGGDKSDYSILPLHELFKATRDELEEYDNVEFIEGFWSHSSLMAKWDIDDQDIKDAYIEMYDELFIPIDEDSIKTSVTLTSSDTGSSCAGLWYTVESQYEQSRQKLVLGSGPSLEHRRGKTIYDFKEIIKEVFAGYRKNFEKLNELKDVTIKYPTGFIYNMAKACDLPAVLYSKAAESFVEEFGLGETNGFTIYAFGLCKILELAEAAKATPRDMLMYQEKIARALQKKFTTYDKEVVIKK